jgi:hypothetical protein
MNGSARPAYKHCLLYLSPFDLTNHLETRQQTLDTARFQKVDPFFRFIAFFVHLLLGNLLPFPRSCFSHLAFA